MRIHITGANGFVGRHLIAQARRQGHDVVALVRSQVAGLAGIEQIVVGDIAERGHWAGAVAGADAVIHLAARVHVMRERGADLDAIYARENTAPTLSLARAAADAGVRRFVFVSSIKVNGEKTVGTPFAASSPPAPVDAYGRSKLRAEEGLRLLAEQSAMGVAVLRPTVVYGLGAAGNIARIAAAVRRGVPLPLGAASNNRSLIAVQNLVTGILTAAEARASGAQTFLLSDPAPISTRALIEHLAEGLGAPSRLVPVPLGVLRLAGKLFDRADDVARLLDDLVVTPEWSALGVSEDRLVSTADGLRAYGRALRSQS